MWFEKIVKVKRQTEIKLNCVERKLKQEDKSEPKTCQGSDGYYNIFMPTCFVSKIHENSKYHCPSKFCQSCQNDLLHALELSAVSQYWNLDNFPPKTTFFNVLNSSRWCGLIEKKIQSTLYNCWVNTRLLILRDHCGLLCKYLTSAEPFRIRTP